MSKRARRTKKRLRRLLRNSMIRGSVFGALVMIALTAPAMKKNVVSASVMCTLATLWIVYFMAANYIAPYYGGHYYLFHRPPQGAQESEADTWQS